MNQKPKLDIILLALAGRSHNYSILMLKSLFLHWWRLAV